VYKINKLGCKWTLNGVAFSCSSTRVNHNELRIMFGFLVPSYSPDTCLSNCTVSHPSRTNVTAVSSDLTTSRWRHLLTCSQTPWQSNIQQFDIWIYNVISIRFWPKFQGIVECHINCDLRFSRWWLWCWLSPWSSHFKPVDMLTSERNLRPSSPWRWRRQLLWNAGAYPQDCTVPQLRNIGVRSVWCAQDGQQQLSRLYPR